MTPSLTDTERGFNYDLNGNITALKRYGASGLENDLTFTHTGNRMTALVDAHATGNEAGTKAFAYDANGNMTSDGRKGLELNWNVLNLVDSAAMHGSSLKYAWLSDGTKVAAKADDGSGNGVQKRYLGSFVYTSNTGSSTDAPTEPESLAWDEGRIFFDSSMAVADDPVLDRGGAGTKRKRVLRPRGNREAADSVGVADSLAWITYYRDCWFAGDHLGNVRSVIDITPGLAAPRVLEQSNYLPYGTRIQSPILASMQDNRWRYAAKEEQNFTSFSTLNLSLLDFGARMYDPFIARWSSKDPQASKYSDTSPSAYCSNNPIGVIDPKGDTTFVVFAAHGAVIFGHIAIAVQDGDGVYRLYSKNGFDVGGEEATESLIGRLSGSASDLGTPLPEGLQAFLDDPNLNAVKNDKTDYPYYTEAYMIPTNQEQDATIAESALEAISRSYSFTVDNCAHTVVQALSKADIPSVSGPHPLPTGGGTARLYLNGTIPRFLYSNIRANNPGGITIRPR